MRLAWIDLQGRRVMNPGADHDLAGFLAIVRDRDPLTFPETIDALPIALQEPGVWRLVIASHPRVILWDGLSEPAAALLARLFETQELALQPCHSGIYNYSERRVNLTAVSVFPEDPQREYWMPCTVGVGPISCLNARWKIGYNAGFPSN
jgi:hypothetical protein